VSFPGKQTEKRKIQLENSERERERGGVGGDGSNKNGLRGFEGNH